MSSYSVLKIPGISLKITFFPPFHELEIENILIILVHFREQSVYFYNNEQLRSSSHL
jgi:hypothetical protein